MRVDQQCLLAAGSVPRAALSAAAALRALRAGTPGRARPSPALSWLCRCPQEPPGIGISSRTPVLTDSPRNPHGAEEPSRAWVILPEPGSGCSTHHTHPLPCRQGDRGEAFCEVSKAILCLLKYRYGL